MLDPDPVAEIVRKQSYRGQIDYTKYEWADFQDLVILISFTAN